MERRDTILLCEVLIQMFIVQVINAFFFPLGNTVRESNLLGKIKAMLFVLVGIG